MDENKLNIVRVYLNKEFPGHYRNPGPSILFGGLGGAIVGATLGGALSGIGPALILGSVSGVMGP